MPFPSLVPSIIIYIPSMMSMTIVRPGGGGRSRLDGLTRWASWHGKRLGVTHCVLPMGAQENRRAAAGQSVPKRAGASVQLACRAEERAALASSVL